MHCWVPDAQLISRLFAREISCKHQTYEAVKHEEEAIIRFLVGKSIFLYVGLRLLPTLLFEVKVNPQNTFMSIELLSIIHLTESDPRYQIGSALC